MRGCATGSDLPRRLSASGSLDVILAWHQIGFRIGSSTAVRVWGANYGSRFHDLIADICGLVLGRGIRAESSSPASLGWELVTGGGGASSETSSEIA